MPKQIKFFSSAIFLKFWVPSILLGLCTIIAAIFGAFISNSSSLPPEESNTNQEVQHQINRERATTLGTLDMHKEGECLFDSVETDELLETWIELSGEGCTSGELLLSFNEIAYGRIPVWFFYTEIVNQFVELTPKEATHPYAKYTLEGFNAANSLVLQLIKEYNLDFFSELIVERLELDYYRPSCSKVLLSPDIYLNIKIHDPETGQIDHHTSNSLYESISSKLKSIGYKFSINMNEDSKVYCISDGCYEGGFAVYGIIAELSFHRDFFANYSIRDAQNGSLLHRSFPGEYSFLNYGTYNVSLDGFQTKPELLANEFIEEIIKTIRCRR